MIWSDQWDDISLISHSYSHTLNLSLLWEQHNENRIFFPNIIVLLLARTTHLDVLFEEYLSGLLLVAATTLLIVAHRRRSPSTPWIFYCPIAFVMLSFVQFYNALFGFQMAWYLVMAALALVLFLLDRPTLGWPTMTGAIIAAMVGSFSSLQGLLIWPCGLVLLYCRRRSRALVFSWLAAAVPTGILYFYHYNFAGHETNGSYSYVLAHPLTAIEFFFLAIGNVIGIEVPFTPHTYNLGVLVLGIFIVVVAVFVVIVCVLRRDQFGPSPLGAALICFGLLFAAVVTEGRAVPGWGLSAGIRYATFNLLIPVGCYMALLERPFAQTDTTKWGAWALIILRPIFIAVVCLQPLFGIANGLDDARSWHRTQLLSADFAVNIDQLPRSLTNTYLIPGFLVDRSFIDRMERVAKAHHLSLFNTSLAAFYAQAGLPSRFRPSTNVVSPLNGAELRGKLPLNANVVAPLGGVSKVEFQLTGGMLRAAEVGTASSTGEGWLYEWDTTTVPDGNYTLRSVVYIDGRPTASKAVKVLIAN